MPYICSTGISKPKYEMDQQEVKELVKEIFRYTTRQVDRLMPVFDNAAVNHRQFVVEKQWFKMDHTFEEKNNLYQKLAIEYSLHAIDDCLQNNDFLSEPIPYNAIDAIIFVSSSGIAAPTIDVHLVNERPFRKDIRRFPLWGLGCAGGAIGITTAYDWVKAYPDKIALVVCCELSSLTFQKGDIKKSNIVGTAIFGDGISTALIVGEHSPYLRYKKKITPKITATSSFIKPNSISVMGWDVTNRGLEVIFSKSIPSLVDTFWKEHVEMFLHKNQLKQSDIHSFIAHPGGKKVLEAMEEVLDCSKTKLKYSYQILKNHGNMSSSTVIYVLREWMKDSMPKGAISILAALGPGFASELVQLEWNE